jgi:hypothetical protein
MLKKITYVLIAILVIIQFIRPSRNEAAGPFENNITKQFPMNAEVEAALQKSCYDCHSNQTKYPSYSMIQPLGWWLQHHIDEGKEHLNFHEFLSYSPKKQDHKLEEIEEAVRDGWMPLDSYSWIHKDAVLNEKEKAATIAWVKESRQNITPSDKNQEGKE